MSPETEKSPTIVDPLSDLLSAVVATPLSPRYSSRQLKLKITIPTSQYAHSGPSDEGLDHDYPCTYSRTSSSTSSSAGGAATFVLRTTMHQNPELRRRVAINRTPSLPTLSSKLPYSAYLYRLAAESGTMPSDLARLADLTTKA